MRRLLAFAALISAPATAQDASYSPVDPTTLMTVQSANASIAALQAYERVFLTDVTLAQSALISLQPSGVQTFTVPTNCQPGDRMFMTANVTLPAGYMLGDITCMAVGTAQARLFTPALGIGVSYSITARVTAFR